MGARSIQSKPAGQTSIDGPTEQVVGNVVQQAGIGKINFTVAIEIIHAAITGGINKYIRRATPYMT